MHLTKKGLRRPGVFAKIQKVSRSIAINRIRSPTSQRVAIIRRVSQ